MLSITKARRGRADDSRTIDDKLTMNEPCGSTEGGGMTRRGVVFTTAAGSGEQANPVSSGVRKVLSESGAGQILCRQLNEPPI